MKKLIHSKSQCRGSNLKGTWVDCVDSSREVRGNWDSLWGLRPWQKTFFFFYLILLCWYRHWRVSFWNAPSTLILRGPSLLTSKLTATTHGWATRPVMLGAGPAHQQTRSSYVSQSLITSLPACLWYLALPQEKDPCSHIRNIPGGSILMTRRKYDAESHRMSPI